jgi:hypothetical protein
MGREVEVSNFPEGNELRSAEDLKDCQEDSEGISHFQLGNDKRSLRDLKTAGGQQKNFKDCQEGKQKSY